MPDGPSASVISVSQTLELLDGQFREFADGVAAACYSFWLGSGISLGRVPGLSVLIPRVLDYMRTRIDSTNANCPYGRALNQALELAGLNQPEIEAIDVETPFSDWPCASLVIQRLCANYSKLLDLDVEGEEDDWLLWSGIDVVNTFADPNIDPDGEHLSIAILVREGVVSEIASANWDGLVEKAIAELAGNDSQIAVCVRAEDLQQIPQNARLYKFHGCAIKARDDEHAYRSFLVGRQSQIHRWRDRAKNAALVARLRDLISTRPTLMLGLSAQDANIQSVFASAEAVLAWPWPSSPPSYVFAEEQIGADQKVLLKNVYHSHYGPTTRDAICSSAHIRAYAKQLLIALILFVLGAKLARLMNRAEGTTNGELAQGLADGITALRNDLAAKNDGNHLAYVRSLIACAGRVRALFQSGDLPAEPKIYPPLTMGSIQQIDGDNSVVDSGLPEAAVTAGLLGKGIADGLWGLDGNARAKAGFGTIRSTAGDARLLIAANETVAIRLFQSGHIEEADEVVLVHCQEIVPRASRSPRQPIGRTGRSRVREVSIKEILAASGNLSELMQQFRQAVVI